MHETSDYTAYLPQLELARLGDESEAGLWITSLPWPRATARDISIGGASTYVKPIGQWPNEAPGSPRRLLLIGDGGNKTPAGLTLKENREPAAALPTTTMEVFETSPDPAFMWERHLLRITAGDKSVGLALGLRHGGEVHWWEACGLDVLEETPHCRVLEMGGAIPRVVTGLKDMMDYPDFTNPFLHKHNWLNGRLFVRVHANGVVEVFAHHINSRSYDEGARLDDVVPVIGIQTAALPQELAEISGSWDGSRAALELGGVRFDLSEAAHLATAERTGSFGQDGSLTVWQPYQAFEVYGGEATHQITGAAYICHSDDKVIPRGAARTVRFSLSLSDRSPRVARYLAPGWWYGACEELTAAPLLPVSSDYNKAMDYALNSIRDNMETAGFEDGSIPNAAQNEQEINGQPFRTESGWKGDIAYAYLMSAWRSGNGEDYDRAMRACYYFTDIGVDHAVKAVRMQGFPVGAFTVTLNRMQASVAAYLETGDPYLLETAEAVVENSHWIHKNSWPRMAVGRDACYANGAVLLYRYFADEHFGRIAYAACHAVKNAQREDGSFGDQGGGSGIHAWSAYITKPWMGSLATAAVVDYLDFFPDDEELAHTVKKFADWLMANRLVHETKHGPVLGWSYQHNYNGQPRCYNMYSGEWLELPLPGVWHHDTLVRVLGFCAFRYNEPAYLDAWAESHNANERDFFDYVATAALTYLPWLQARLWNAKQPETPGDAIHIKPWHFGPRTPQTAVIAGPNGEINVAWTEDGDIEAAPTVVIEKPAEVVAIA